MKITLLSSLAFLALFSLSPPGLAHTDAYLDSLTTPHGGQVRMAGSYHFELLVEKTQVTIYVTDHAFRPQSTKDAKGTIKVMVDSKETSPVELIPTGENQLVGKGEFTVTPTMEVIVSITLDGQEQQARFKPWLKIQGSSGEEKSKKDGTASSSEGEHGEHKH